MFEDAVNAAYAINPEGSILASAQTAGALPGVQPKLITAFVQAKAEQAQHEANGPLAGAPAPTTTTSFFQLLKPCRHGFGTRRHRLGPPTIIDEPDWGQPLEGEEPSLVTTAPLPFFVLRVPRIA